MLETGVLRDSVIRGRRNPQHLSLPRRLRAAREEAGLSLRTLADRVGLDPSAIYTIENGTVPRLDSAERIARALGMSPCVLVYNVEAPPATGDDLQCAAVGQRLLQVRTARGLSRKALGIASGTSDTTVRQTEGGENMPTVATVEKLAKALGCDPCWLAYGQGTAPDLTPAAT